MNITIISNESGEWVAIYKDNKSYFQGHSIPTWVFLDLLNELGVETETMEKDENFDFPDNLQD